MDSEIAFDPQKAAHNLRKHGVSFAHAEQALRDPQGITIEDPDAQGEHRLVTLGLDSLGRVLVVIHTARAGCTRLISARKAGKNEALHHAQSVRLQERQAWSGNSFARQDAHHDDAG